MYSEGSQCNESPLMVAFAMQQMLLQSFDGQLHVFPALPSSWPVATFYQMRTEGAFLVSASARSGNTYAIQVQSLAGSPCIVRADFGGKRVQSDPIGVVTVLPGGQMQLQLMTNESVLIWPVGAPRPGPTEFAPVPIASANVSHFGVPGHGRVPPPVPPPPAQPCKAVDGYNCYQDRCADDNGKVSAHCGVDLCWPSPLSQELCSPLPKDKAATTAAARCSAESRCHGFGMNPVWTACPGPPPKANESCAKFFSVSNASQLLPADGWSMWLRAG